MEQPNETKVVYRRRLYQQIADDIERLILDGVYPPDSRLPSEQELADQYSVSRNVIREALKSLKEQDLVSIRTGSGTYVRRPGTEPVSEALTRFVRHSSDNFSISHLYEIRRMIEPECASLAAKRSSKKNIEIIETLLKSMEIHQDDHEKWSQADLNFHRAVAEATQNPLACSILDAIIDPLKQVIIAGAAEPNGTLAGLKAHLRIFDAIMNQNSSEARAAMFDHLLDSETRIKKILAKSARNVKKVNNIKTT